MIPTWSIGVRRYVTGTEQTCHVNDMKSLMRPADACTSREKAEVEKKAFGTETSMARAPETHVHMDSVQR